MDNRTLDDAYDNAYDDAYEIINVHYHSIIYWKIIHPRNDRNGSWWFQDIEAQKCIGYMAILNESK